MKDLDRNRFNSILSRITRAVTASSEKHGVTQFRGEDTPLFEAIAPAFYITRVFGLGPYHFSKDRLVPSNMHLIFSFFALFFNSYVVITVLIRFTIKGNQPILGVTEQAKVIFNYATMLVNIFVAISTRKRFVEVWSMIQDFDYDTNKLGFPQIENGTKLRVWGILLINVLIWVWINQTGMLAFHESWLPNVTYMMVYLSTFVAVFKFSGMVCILGLRFKHLIKITRICCPSKIDRKRNPRLDSKVLERFYADLVTASRKLNSIYFWPLLFWIFNLCSHTVSNTYFIITAFSDRDFELLTELCLLGWFMAYVSQLLALTFACEFASTEANRMGYVLLNWRRWEIYHNKKELESTLHLMNYKLNFSAGGCCYVNLRLLCSISALLSTYLVILLQLPSDERMNHTKLYLDISTK